MIFLEFNVSTDMPFEQATQVKTPQGIVKGSLIVLRDLPPDLSRGLFAHPGGDVPCVLATRMSLFFYSRIARRDQEGLG